MKDPTPWNRFAPSGLLVVFVAAILWSFVGASLGHDVRAIAPALVVIGLGFAFVGGQRLRTPGWNGARYWESRPKVARLIAGMMALGSTDDANFGERMTALMQFGFGACMVIIGVVALVVGTPTPPPT